ncbi:hypothetical protein [Ekhidna sp.]
MRNALKSLSFLFMLGTLIFISSCGDDDGGGIIIDDGDDGSFVVADGMYIAGLSGTDTVIVNAAKLSAAVVEDESFGTQDRDGFTRAWVYLSAGNYVFAEIADQEAVAVYGGTLTTETVDPSNPDLGPDSYGVVALEENGATFSIANSGVHYISFDNLTDEALVVEIGNWGILGGSVYESACTGIGFSDDITLTKGTSSADGTTWSASSIILRDGEVKFRTDDVWKIDRREIKDDFLPASGYVAFLNVGGETLDVLTDGGANTPFTDSNGGGVYDISLDLSSNGEFAATLSRTGDAEECSFDPANFTWGIVGAAVWPHPAEFAEEDHEEVKFQYSGQDGDKYIWRGVFPLDEGGKWFKFRTDNTWANKITSTAQGVTKGDVTDNTEDGSISMDDNSDGSSPDGNWYVDANPGFYYFEISTSDLGATWDISLDEASFGVVGNGSPAGAWPDDMNPTPDVAMTYGDDLESLSITGDFTDETWKIRVNQSWDLNIGGVFDGSALSFNGLGDDFSLSSAGNYTVEIKTEDGGATFTGTATSNAARQ